jgi:adenylate cyclase
MVHHCRAEPEKTNAYATENLELSQEHGMAQSLGWATFWQGWALSELGESVRGIAQMRGAIEAYRRIGSRIAVPKFMGLLAEALRRAGEADEAMHLLEDALRECRETGQAYYEPELLTYRARGLRDAGDAGGADADLAEALELARRQGARLWEQVIVAAKEELTGAA